MSNVGWELGHTHSLLAPGIAPGLAHVGVMLAYTPLHHLLLEAMDRPLVMTSGNMSDEPIATNNDEAFDRLSGIADGFLLHDREIVARCDDSVLRVVDRARSFCVARAVRSAADRAAGGVSSPCSP
jgi:hydrogenase maturation protein HypF